MYKDIFHKVDIPLDELENVNKLFFSQVQMNEDRVLRKFGKQYEETKSLIFSSVRAEGIYTTSEIEKNKSSEIHLKNGIIIANNMLSELFALSTEVTACAVTLHGYDELEDETDSTLMALFLDGWGTAVAECANTWIKKCIKEDFAKRGLHATSSWSPGQHNIDIKLQKVLFEMLRPESIGITLTESFMMHPKKSISGFIGGGSDENAEKIKPCDFCELRDKCPSAYAE